MSPNQAATYRDCMMAVGYTRKHQAAAQREEMLSGRVAEAATNTIPIVALMGGDQHAGAIAPTLTHWQTVRANGSFPQVGEVRPKRRLRLFA